VQGESHKFHEKYFACERSLVLSTTWPCLEMERRRLCRGGSLCRSTARLCRSRVVALSVDGAALSVERAALSVEGAALSVEGAALSVESARYEGQASDSVRRECSLCRSRRGSSPSMLPCSKARAALCRSRARPSRSRSGTPSVESATLDRVASLSRAWPATLSGQSHHSLPRGRAPRPAARRSVPRNTRAAPSTACCRVAVRVTCQGTTESVVCRAGPPNPIGAAWDHV
jgi:hypothetical protein